MFLMATETFQPRPLWPNPLSSPDWGGLEQGVQERQLQQEAVTCTSLPKWYKAAAAGCSLCQSARSWSSRCPELMGAVHSQPAGRDLQRSLHSPSLQHLADTPASSGTHGCSPTPICSPAAAED